MATYRARPEHALLARRVLAALLAVVALAALLLGLAWRPPISPVDPPAVTAFDAEVVRRGEQLAGLGNCAACHTLPEGMPYAGGVPLATPFGTIHGTNITPDPATGIGRWSEEAFRRALREGLDRRGRHLYPAFPYDHFVRTSDEDLHALYAYFMTRTPVTASAPRNRLVFPLGFRPLIAAWKALYLDPAPVEPQPRLSAEWNRGQYLVHSLGHCSSCHSPREALGNEDKRRYFDGGDAEGWYAPALNGKSPSPVPWDTEQLVTYLRTGLAGNHAIAGGPMQGVVRGLARASPADVRAIAVYIDSTFGAPTPLRADRAKASLARASEATLPPAPAAVGGDPALALGTTVYTHACASCHDLGRGISSSGALKLPLAIAVHDPDPRSLIRIVLDGIAPPDNGPGRWMPAFGDALTDAQVVALLAYLRTAAAGAPPWPDLDRQVKDARKDAPG
jgi:mono/diheme cytochrome c family protein